MCTLYQTVEVFREDRALQVAVRSSPLSMTSESFGTTTAGSRTETTDRERRSRGSKVTGTLECGAGWRVLLTVDVELHFPPDLRGGVFILRATLVDSAVFAHH